MDYKEKVEFTDEEEAITEESITIDVQKEFGLILRDHRSESRRFDPTESCPLLIFQVNLETNLNQEKRLWGYSLMVQRFNSEQNGNAQ